MTERICHLTLAEQDAFDPEAFTAKLKAAGFKFDREICPVKIRKPWSWSRLDDGTVEYRQTEIL